MNGFQTEAEVKNIVTTMLKDAGYTDKFDQLFASLNQIKGGGAVLGLIVIVLQAVKMIYGK